MAPGAHAATQPAALVAHARNVSVDQRTALAERLRSEVPAGCLLLETCHRVELYARPTDLDRLAAAGLPEGSATHHGSAAARHLLQVAVGRESAVVAEDQLLHQLRLAVHRAREHGPLFVELDRLADLALRAGRRARSWLPARRKSLAEAALERVLDPAAEPGTVLVLGAGEMGRRAARALAARGAELLVASRTPERAAGLAAALGARPEALDPGPAQVGRLNGLILALAGPWQPAADTREALLRSGAWVVDLSAPSALPRSTAEPLGGRLVSIDDLAVDRPSSAPSEALLERLDALVETTLRAYEEWTAGEVQRTAARALAAKAQQAQAAELDALWQRVPQLGAEQREEVERMARHLTERLLRDPLERLHEDRDGRRASAARDLFRL